jgi:hypothetical protein
MTEFETKEQITCVTVDALLCLEPKDKARQQIFQILSKENSPNTATARCMIKDVLRDNGHTVDHERIQLCIDTFQRLTNGFALWLHRRGEDDKESYPAWELTKILQAEESVNWADRWQKCGGRIYSGERIVALKDDPIWLKISDFSLPFPPFALNSGMGWFEVSRQEFLDLGGQLPEVSRSKIPYTKHELEALEQYLAALKSGAIKYRVKVEIVKDKPQIGKNPKASR